MSRGSDGKCSACHQSYLNTETGKCVVSTKIIDFVRNYDGDGIVKDCKNGYYKSSKDTCTLIN